MEAEGTKTPSETEVLGLIAAASQAVTAEVPETAETGVSSVAEKPEIGMEIGQVEAEVTVSC